MAAEHSKRVADHLRECIRADGSIGFAEFMHEALYARGLGYYVAGAQKFGVDGDFVTAPEVSTLFGRVLAEQVASVLEQVPGGSILELGAGSGSLAVAMLARLSEINRLPERYAILEISADLRKRQQQAIEAALPETLANRVEWLPDLPRDFAGAIVANEVADALPVERFGKHNGQFMQYRVRCDEEAFAWSKAPAPDELHRALQEIERYLQRQFDEGFQSEISLGLPAWINGLARSLQAGFVFLFDYGLGRREYYAPERRDGWLRCHYRHRVHNDPFRFPGIQDLTAWVDFTAIAEAAVQGGMDVAGFVSQAHFLLNGGLDHVVEDFAALSTTEQVTLSREIKRLTLPSEMGENFKCMGLGRGNIESPPAFAGFDRTHTL